MRHKEFFRLFVANNLEKFLKILLDERKVLAEILNANQKFYIIKANKQLKLSKMTSLVFFESVFGQQTISRFSSLLERTTDLMLFFPNRDQNTKSPEAFLRNKKI